MSSTRIPDQLGRNSDRAIQVALGLEKLSVARLCIDYNANTVAVDVYLLDKAGQVVVGQDRAPVTTRIEYPVSALSARAQPDSTA